jgi:hypothetical protein
MGTSCPTIPESTNRSRIGKSRKRTVADGFVAKIARMKNPAAKSAVLGIQSGIN